MEDLALDTRERLPDALRVLLADYPRDAWEAHPRFSGLVQFWLERHMMFRRLLELLETDNDAMLDKALDPKTYGGRISRFGGMLVNQLHGHHQIEDLHYFPVLSGLEPKLDRGFGILDKDHQAMDGLLNRFTVSANGVLQAIGGGGEWTDPTAAFAGEVTAFGRMLRRHLEDEEDLIVPVILKNGAAGLA